MCTCSLEGAIVHSNYPYVVESSGFVVVSWYGPIVQTSTFAWFTIRIANLDQATGILLVYDRLELTCNVMWRLCESTILHEDT